MLPDRLKTLRLEAKLTQNEIAKKLQISKMTYSYWENGKRNPKNIQQIADFFNVSTDYLLGNTDEKNSIPEIDIVKAIYNSVTYKGENISDIDKNEINSLLENYFKNKK